ncbi:MAG: FAD-dependent oxidoreductase [Desulfitobacteriia bacterium]
MKMLNQDVLIIGGGIAGMQAALDIAASGRSVVLADKDEILGGHVKDYTCLFPDLSDGRALAAQKIARIEASSNITVKLLTEVSDLERCEGGFKASFTKNSVLESQNFGAVVIAAGYGNFDGTKYGEYGYGRYPGVITGIEFEQNMAEILRKPVKTALFIKCVGARDRSKGMPYCSKICCMYTAKQAKELKNAHPAANVYVTYMDIRANFKNGEEFVRSVMEEERVRYIRGRVGKVFPVNDRLIVRMEDTLKGVPQEIEADLVVLATAMVPINSTNNVVKKVGGRVDGNGFIASLPLAESLNPMEVAKGVYYAGACGFPCDVREALNQGSAAAAGVLSYFSKQREAVNE